MSPTRKLFAVAVAVSIGCGGSTTGDTGSGVGDGGGGGDGGGAGDGSGATNDGSTTLTDGGGGGGTGAIACGQTTCSAQTQDCCVTNQGGATCGAKGSCQGSSLSCSSSGSCGGGQVCCAAFVRDGGVGGALNATCAQACSGQQAQLCATDAECPAGDRCRQAFGGLKTCRPSFDGGAFDGGGFPTDAGFGGG